MDPLDQDVRPVMTEWGVEVQPLVVVNGRMIYGLQPKQELAFHHTPLSDRWHEHGGATRIGYGGAAGGAKSHTARALATCAAFRWPGSTSIIFRKTLPELEANHIQKIREEVPGSLYEWNGRYMRMKWVNGSYTYFGYLRSDEDKFRYQGPEYDVMIFEEATHYQWQTVSWLIGNRLRATVGGAVPFALFPSNPGNVGHHWYRRLFIDRRYDPDREERAEDHAFIQARLEDNEILRRRDPAYERKLNQLPEPHRSWLKDGDFAAGAGVFFSELDRRVHLVEPFRVPEHWPLFGGFDWGFSHPWRLGVYAVDEDATVWKLATLGGWRQTHDELLASIFDQARAHSIDMHRVGYIASGLDTFHRRGRELGYEGPTLAEKMLDAGLNVIEAEVGRVHGATNLREYLHWSDEPYLPPALRFMKNAGNLRAYECLETRVADEDMLEDVLKTDADEFGEGGDDDYDETRYALASRPPRAASIGLNRPISAFDPEVLAHEARVKYTVREAPIRGEQKDRPPGF